VAVDGETDLFTMAWIFASLFLKRSVGRIVSIGSSSGTLTLNSNPNFELRHIFGAAYSPSKMALHASSLAFELELGKTNIKINKACLCNPLYRWPAEWYD
jgi:NAD(P)-dependent dehydrogenase (short-subunit alcohol dehydrogenase family)